METQEKFIMVDYDDIICLGDYLSGRLTDYKYVAIESDSFLIGHKARFFEDGVIYRKVLK